MAHKVLIVFAVTIIAFSIITKSQGLSVGNCEFGICENHHSYPEAQIKKLLEESGGAYSSYSGNVITPPAEPHVSSRGDFGFNVETLCESSQRTVKPRLQKDVNNEVRFIVNLEDASMPFEQVLKFETCAFGNTTANLPCRNSALLRDDYLTGCAQKENIIKLLYLSKNGDKLEYGKFVIPSACVCTYSPK